MKKLNKKGFTLIELLAVIVILAILVAVAVPAVTRYLNTARKGTYADNAQAAISVVRNHVISQFGAVNSGDFYINGACMVTVENNGEKTTTADLNISKDACTGENKEWAEGINDFLEKKLISSPYGNPYKDDSYVHVDYDIGTGSYSYSICLYDDLGYGFYLTEEQDIKEDSVKSGLNSCTPPTPAA